MTRDGGSWVEPLVSPRAVLGRTSTVLLAVVYGLFRFECGGLRPGCADRPSGVASYRVPLRRASDGARSGNETAESASLPQAFEALAGTSCAMDYEHGGWAPPWTQRSTGRAIRLFADERGFGVAAEGE